MSGTVIKPCTCQHEFQDKEHGRGMRVHNINPKGIESCTVCSGPPRSGVTKQIAAWNLLSREQRILYGGRP